MKKRYFLIPLLGILCFFLVFALASCSKDEEEENLDADKGAQVADIYGFMRPENCWLTECVILNKAPDPSTMEPMFGTEGKSGLASEYVLKEDGQLSESGEYYLICLVYGTPGQDAEIKTNMRFSYVDGTTVLHNENCVDVGEPTARGDLDLGLDRVVLQNPADRRIFVEYIRRKETTVTDEGWTIELDSYAAVQGMLVVPFSVTNTNKGGTLYVELSLDVDGVSGEYNADSTATLNFGNDRADSAKAEISQMSVHYLTSEAYRDGNYSEGDLSKNASFANGDFCYMVVDFTVKTLETGGDTKELRAMAVVPDRNILAIGVEEAPTAKVEKITHNDITTICAYYNIPSTAGEEKKVRMVFFLRPINGGVTEMDLLIDGAGSFSVNGEVWKGPDVTSPKNVFLYTLNSDGRSYSVSGFDAGYSLDPIIPDCWGADLLPVTMIGDHAFKNSEISTITIPSSVTTIGDGAFRESRGLVSVIFKDNSQLTRIGDRAFQSCAGLTSIAIPPSVTSIGESAFYACNLTSITIPSSVTFIGVSAFSNCTRLTSITIPEGVSSICSFTFYHCTSLTSIAIPSSVTDIFNDAFRGCTSLKSIIIPDRVTFISDRVFEDCSSLTSVVIPSSVTYIGAGAFSACDKLDAVYYGGNATDWSEISIDINADIFWATRYYYSASSPAEDGNWWHYDENGNPVVWP